MNKEEAIIKIKESLKSLMKFESNDKKVEDEVKVKMSEVLTQDGMIISYDGEELELNIEVFLLDEAGNRIAIEDKEYMLQNGMTLVIKDGKISEMIAEIPADVEESPIEEANTMMSEENSKEINDLKESIKLMDEKFEKITEALKSLIDISEDYTKKVEEFSKQPGGEPIIVKTNEKDLSSEELRTERFKAIKTSLKK